MAASVGVMPNSVTRGWMAASQAVVLLGPVRRTESIWRWASGGTTVRAPGGGMASPAVGPAGPTGAVLGEGLVVAGGTVVVEVGTGQRRRQGAAVVGGVVGGPVVGVVVAGGRVVAVVRVVEGLD